MQNEEIKAALMAAIPQCDVQVTSDGNHISLVVISPAFVDLSPVKKQQLVYGALQPAIADGSIHAVHMKTFTPTEWEQHNT